MEASGQRSDLDGLSVLITRPHPKGLGLAQRITALGGTPWLLPAIEILPAPASDLLGHTLARLEDYQLLIFISPSAVEHAHPWLPPELPAGLRIAAVGGGTAAALAARQRTPTLVPHMKADSEGLLELPQLHQLQGQRVLILRGNGGREHLAEGLRARGAQVDYAEVYRRVCPQYSPDQLDLPWHRLDVICVTSGEGLTNLLHILGRERSNQLLHKRWILVSERTAHQASAYGLSHITLASGADDPALITAICTPASCYEASS